MDPRPSELAGPDGAGVPETTIVRLGWSEAPPSVAIVEAVAAVKDEDPLDQRALGESLDADALELLLASAESDGDAPALSVRFRYEGCLVRAHASGFDVVLEEEP